jgi:dTDP-4-amino-4,6-dideoxygalactose transaminase
VARRRKIAQKYTEAFQDTPKILVPTELPGCRHVYHLFIIRLQGRLAGKRKEVFEELQRRGIGVQVHYIPIPSQPYYRRLGYRVEDYPKAQSYCQSAISLPMFPKLTSREVAFVVKVVKDVVRFCSK